MKVSVLSGVVKKIESMARMEEKYASSLSASVRGMRNVVVKEVLRSIAHDSRKHAGFYAAILSLLKGESPAITEEDYDRLEDVIKKHIEVESVMMQEIKQLLDIERDSRIKHLLIEVYEDEAKHHTLMERLLDAVIKRETIFEEDVWNMLWGDVPGHGAPLG